MRIKTETRYSYPDNKPYKIWVREYLRMPLISPDVLNCSVYLYASREDAEQGEHWGGSGFVLCVPGGSAEPLVPPPGIERILATLLVRRGHRDRWHYYLVTNRHIAEKFRFARVNSWPESTRIYDVRKAIWVYHENQDDVAVCPITLDEESDEVQAVPLDMLVNQELAGELHVGPGDSVYMVGKFIYHSGRQRNLPAVRFGHIAMMPLEPIKSQRPGGIVLNLEGYLVEANSLAGYSGSPVFLTIAPWELEHLKGAASRKSLAQNKDAGTLWLLGITWGHLPVELDAKAEDGTKLKVTLNAGMMCVAPAWKILDVLNAPELVEQRTIEREGWRTEGAAIPD